jgi:CHAD domain-containing protein
MIHTVEQVEARHQLRVARRHLRECEVAFDEHLEDDPMRWIEEIAKAERQIARARSLVLAAGG